MHKLSPKANLSSTNTFYIHIHNYRSYYIEYYYAAKRKEERDRYDR